MAKVFQLHARGRMKQNIYDFRVCMRVCVRQGSAGPMGRNALYFLLPTNGARLVPDK